MAVIEPRGVSRTNTGEQPKLLVPAPTVQDPWLATIERLERTLALQQTRFQVLESYYQGQHPGSQFSSVTFQQAFGRQLRGFADNWMRLIVAATNNRLKVQGFRVGDGKDATDVASSDDIAWRVWKCSHLRQGSRMAHKDAMKFGTTFALVDPEGADESTPPVITIESPFQVVGERDSSARFRLNTAIKKWVGNDGRLYLNLYTPDVVLKYSASAETQSYTANDPSRLLQGAAWTAIGEVENPLGVVPIIPIENEPDLLLGGLSDLEDIIPLNDGLNKTVRDMLIASEYQAFRQRYVTGVEVPKDPVTGKPLTEQQMQLQASARRLWTFPHPDAKVGELSQIDLAPYIQAIDMFIHHLSMVSTTPAYMLVGKMANLPLALDTVVPTPSGRTTMGEIRAGDDVYAPDGSVQKVVDVLPIRYGRQCYRMQFDDGTEITADAEHKWETTHFVDPAQPYGRRKGAQRETSIVTTAQIAASLKTSMGTNNHFLLVSAAHVGPTLIYPIAPFALGSWLGDGSRHLPQITSHVRDAGWMADRLRAVGEVVAIRKYPEHDELHRDTRTIALTHDAEKCLRGHVRSRGTKYDSARCPTCAHAGYRRRVYGDALPEPVNAAFGRRLREIGVWKNKHIPEQYFRGSVEQRLELLRGIMDTDGTVNKDQGSVSIGLHDERLARDVHRLAQSLGHKVRLRRGMWRSTGKGLVSARTGEHWQMSWTPPHIVFSMPRKACLQRLPVEGGDGKSSLPFRRYIVSCQPTESVPVRCINVSGASHLFCVTNALVPTHNSADAIRAAELGFVGKLEGKQTDYGVGWEQVMALAFRAMNHPAADDTIETVWSSAAANSGSVLSNELAQMNAIGVPRQVLWGRYGASPQEVEMWENLNKLNGDPPTGMPTGVQATHVPTLPMGAPDG